MKSPSLFLIIFALLMTSFLLMGFQCGSTDMTTAKLAIQRGDIAAAEKSLLKEVKKNPTNGEGWYYLGFCQLDKREFTDMLASFDQSLKYTKEFQDKIHTGHLSAWGQLFNEALSYHNMIPHVSKDSVQIVGQKAIDLYNLANKCVSDSPATYQNLAAVYVLLGDYDNEIANLEIVQKLDPRKANPREVLSAYIMKGDNLIEKKDTVHANEAYKQAIEQIKQLQSTSPNDLDLMKTMVGLYDKMGDQDQAVSVVQEIVKVKPDDKEFQNYFGYLLSRAGKLDEALVHIEAAIQIDSNFVDALNNAGLIYSEIGQDMKAKMADQTPPDNGTTKKGKNKNKPAVEDKPYIEKYAKSAMYFKRLSVLKPDDANIFEALGSALINSGNIKEGKAAMDEADRLRKK